MVVTNSANVASGRTAMATSPMTSFTCSVIACLPFLLTSAPSPGVRGLPSGKRGPGPRRAFFQGGSDHDGTCPVPEE
ncbi:hypothetical protein GCM10017600_61010 [Streptosporangium carneum]|uniref:Uncharacterized protein n=1 Tax=Streptosporangium carneum TaxID=47481 RepID=A0A9W6I624_9ACTN|nr:hypothetical protein GCM10017600_61010 [Streptosporangium carneum]